VTLVATAVTLCILGVAAVVMLAVQERQLFDAVDVSLTETVQQVQDDLDVDFGTAPGTAPVGESPAESASLADRVEATTSSLQLLSASGEVLSASGSLEGETALIDVNDATDDASEVIGEFATVDGRSARFRVAAAAVNDEVLVAGYSLADVDQSIANQRRVLLVAIPLVSALLGGLIWVVLGRALKPVEAMRSEVSRISGAELSRRVAVPEGTAELASLASTMNDMLERLDASATRQNQFVSDAAHELRSPLAGIRGQLEVNLTHPDAPERAESEQSILAETVRLQALVDNLLTLARSGAASPTATTPTPAHSVALDLDDLVLEEAANLRRSSAKAINIEAVSAAQVRGDGEQLRRVIRNLADNAVRHSNSTVWFALTEEPGSVRLTVTDDGPGIAPDHSEAVFDRFTRLDESRARDAGGSGLGLAISREIVQRHGGSIRLDTAHVGGARFVVELPSP
jgi:signal transduction histidine kinase